MNCIKSIFCCRQRPRNQVIANPNRTPRPPLPRHSTHIQQKTHKKHGLTIGPNGRGLPQHPNESPKQMEERKESEQHIKDLFRRI